MEYLYIYASFSHMDGYNMWFSHMEDLDAPDKEGKTALEIAHHDDGMIALLTALRDQISAGKLNKMVSDSRLRRRGEVADYAAIMQFADEHGLDVNSAVARETKLYGRRFCMDRSSQDDTYAAVLNSIDTSDLPRLQFLLKVQHSAATSVYDENGRSLVHIAAGRSSERIESIQHFNGYSKGSGSDTGSRMRHMVEEENSCLDRFFFDSSEWNGKSDLLEAMKARQEKDRADKYQGHYRLRTDEPEERCTGLHVVHKDDQPNCPTVDDRLGVLRWLLSCGLPLPECGFIVRDCDLPAAQMLLEYRLASDEAVDSRFRDTAPAAAELIKQFLYRTTQDAQQTAADLAMLCTSRSTDDIHHFTCAARIRLLMWLVRSTGVKLLDLRTSNGDTILHEAVRHGDVGLAIWLASNYRTLNFTHGEKSGKLPVHWALSLTEQNKTINETENSPHRSLHKVMIKYAGESRMFKEDIGMDERVFELADRNGKTVKDYMEVHCEEYFKEHFTNLNWEKSQISTLCFFGRTHCPQGHLLCESRGPPECCSGCCIDANSKSSGILFRCTACHFNLCSDCHESEPHHAAEASLSCMKALCDRCPAIIQGDTRADMPFLYAAISHGRLDVLQWMETAYYLLTTCRSGLGG